MILEIYIYWDGEDEICKSEHNKERYNTKKEMGKFLLNIFWYLLN